MEGSRERVFSVDEATSIITCAEAEYKVEKDTPVIKKLLGDKGNKSLTLSDIHNISDDLNLPEEYIDNYIDKWYPSVSTQLEDIEDLGAVPKNDIVFNTYQREIVNVLRNSIPGQKFKAVLGGDSHPNLNFSRQRTATVKKPKYFGRFGERKVKKEFFDPLATFQFESDYLYNLGPGQFNLSILIYEPVFPRVCKNTIKDLNRKFDKYLQNYSVKHMYEPGK